MSHPVLSSVLARASRSIDLSSQSEATDGGLLTQFIQTKDEAAFAELVRRLGPMVLGVCRRITGDSHLAEDAFQAAFLVLARRANDVRLREGVRGWLYGVAVRTAKGARAVSAHRRAREVTISSLPDRSAELKEPTDNEAIRLLDEEVGTLPDHLRVVVVLCELEGLSRKVVAERLKIPEGTLSSRLAKARKVLAERLLRRGVVLPVAVLGSLGLTATAVPARLITQTSALASTTALPPLVASLANGVIRIMFLDKLKITIPLAAIAVGLLACTTLVAIPPTSQPVKPQSFTTPVVLFAAKHLDPVPAKVEPKPLPKGPNKLLFWRAGCLTMIDPDGQNEKKVSEDRGKFHPGNSKLSPDGKKLAVLIPNDVENLNLPRNLYVRELTEKEPGTDLGFTCQMFAWSPDGTKIATSDFVDGPGKQLAATHYLVDVKTKEKTSIKLPDNHIITDWSGDGKYFLTTSTGLNDDKPSLRIHLMNLDGTEHKVLTDAKELAGNGQLSPEGTRVLYFIVQPPKEKQVQARHELNVLEIATGKKTVVADQPLNGDIQGYCWSPDGKQIAYTWREIHEGKPEDLAGKETESHLVVCNPDGKNQKTIASEKGQGPWIITIGAVDWR